MSYVFDLNDAKFIVIGQIEYEKNSLMYPTSYSCFFILSILVYRHVIGKLRITIFDSERTQVSQSTALSNLNLETCYKMLPWQSKRRFSKNLS